MYEKNFQVFCIVSQLNQNFKTMLEVGIKNEEYSERFFQLIDQFVNISLKVNLNWETEIKNVYDVKISEKFSYMVDSSVPVSLLKWS